MTNQEKMNRAQDQYLQWFDKAYTAKQSGKDELAARWFERGNWWLNQFNKLSAR